MRIKDYLVEIEAAAAPVIALLYKEEQRLVALTDRLARLTEETRRGYEQADRMEELAAELATDPSFVDDDTLAGAAARFETYFGVDKERHETAEKLKIAQESLDAHQFARDCLAGAVLQFAKQGISMRHGKLTSCPSGRAIGSQDLKRVIWQGRNQAMHWEEGNPHPPVVAAMEALARDFGGLFQHYRTRSVAFELVVLLGWKSWAEFSADLQSLDP